jgi:hypothetical protein
MLGPLKSLNVETVERDLDARCWMLDAGFWLLVARYWVLDAGFWMMDAHSGRRCRPLPFQLSAFPIPHLPQEVVLNDNVGQVSPPVMCEE